MRDKSKLPVYRTKPGIDDPTMLPPFVSRHLHMRYFPLAADSERLQAYLDEFVSLAGGPDPVPPEVGVFRPALPFVFVVAAHHKELTPDANHGVLAQEETSLGFFAEWRRKEGDALVFEDWVWVNVLVLVDSEISVITGRSLWGWPKLHAESQSSVGMHTRDETRLSSIERLSAPLPTVGFGAAETFVLEIDAGSGPSWSEGWMSMPPGLPWLKYATDWAGGAIGAWMSSLKLGLEAARSFDPGLIERAWRRGGTALLEVSPRAFIDTRVISLKQFRDAESPERACYQALILSKMETEAFHGAGLLGETAVYSGDPSGNYRVRVRRERELELVERLGLVSERDDDEEEGDSLVTLRPLMPFWLEIDAGYDRGKVLCHRDSTGSWSTSEAESSAQAQVARVGKVAYQSLSSAQTESPIELVTAQRSGAREASNESEAIFLPLRVDKPDQLENTLANYYGPAARLAEQYVYAVLGSSRPPKGQRRSTWQLSLCVPLRYEEGATPLFVAPFEYLSDSRMALFAREIQGRETRLAQFEDEPGAWLGGPSQRRLMRIRCELFSKVGVSEACERHALFELWTGEAQEAVRGEAPAWGAKTFESHFASKTPIEGPALLSLKQFRDAENPELACYQELVETPLRLEATEFRPLESLELRILRHPSYLLSKALGLEVASASRGRVPVERLRPVAPFRASAKWSWQKARVGGIR
jgi:hypothetical protein